MRFRKLFLVLLGIAYVFSYAPLHAENIHTESESQAIQAPPEKLPQSEIVTPRTAAIYMDRCLSKIPRKFTPDAHEDYCLCTAAKMRTDFTNSDLENLASPSSRKPGNKSFEKFVEKIVVPCMEKPIIDITYMQCIMDRSMSPLIYSIPAYCQCAGEAMTPFIKGQALSTIMLNMSQYPNDFKEPLDALLRSENVIKARKKAYSSCKGAYFRQKPAVIPLPQ